MTPRARLRIALASLLLASVLVSPASATPHQCTMFSFAVASSPVGHSPESGVIQADDGRLYGTTSQGGVTGQGGVYSLALDGSGFRMTTDGTVEIIHSFPQQEGGACRSGFTLASDNMLYAVTSGATGHGSSNGSVQGTTVQGGSNATGTLFKIRP